MRLKGSADTMFAQVFLHETNDEHDLRSRLILLNPIHAERETPNLPRASRSTFRTVEPFPRPRTCLEKVVAHHIQFITT